jgi:hypothetical protein
VPLPGTPESLPWRFGDKEAGVELKRNSWIVRWAYLPDPSTSPIPDRVSLCPLFWRVVLFVPLFCVFAAVILTALSPIIVTIWAYGKYAEKTGRRDLAAIFTNSIVAQRVVAAKNRVCPIVDLV